MKTAQLLLTIVLASPVAARAADIPPLESAWYRVEILIFERSFAASDASPGEVLTLHAPRAFPRATQALVDDERTRAAAYPLDAATLAEPALPVVDGQRNARVVPVKPAAPPPSTPKPEPTPMQRAADIVSAYEADLRSSSLRAQPANSLLLKQEAGRLQRDPAYRVVLHTAWIQPVPDRDRPMPLLIQTGERFGNAWRIEGTIDITLARYLHVDARLWYRPDPTAPVQSADASVSLATTAGDAYLELREQRRVRSGELHYFDHPKFGMLMRIDPVPMPDNVLAQLSAILGAPVAPPKDISADAPERAPLTGPARIP